VTTPAKTQSALEQLLGFFSWRLHHRRFTSRLLGLAKVMKRCVTRRFAVELPAGRTETIDHVDGSVLVRCAKGRLWITHDGDPKDVVLDTLQTYRAERRNVMRVHALVPCVVEFQFEDAR
jgi:hypothetical protein